MDMCEEAAEAVEAGPVKEQVRTRHGNLLKHRNYHARAVKRKESII